MMPDTRQTAPGHDAPALSLDEALIRVRAALTPSSLTERVALRTALGRILAEDVRSLVDVPGHDNSAMDGYALRSDDLSGEGEIALECVGEAFAGHPFDGRVGAGQCVRIMTGGVLPAGADMVVMQEKTVRSGDRVTMPDEGRAGQNVRLAGEDLRRGEVALEAGKRLMPAELGILASIGVGEVLVRRCLTVAFFSTGDELRSIGDPLGPGEIYDSNRYTLYGMLARLGVNAVDLGVVPDDRQALERALKEAAQRADVVIASGGVSVGEADYVTEVLERLGRVDFWRIAVKPGRPLAFGHVHDAVFFGLPGNPVSVMATFYQVVRPALLYLSGAGMATPLQLRARLLSPLRKSPGRREFQRGVVEPDGEGGYTVRGLTHQGSGVLRSMSEGNCFIVLPDDSGSVEAGELVTVEPFAAFI